ncbi:MAG TPA: cupin domain-containing protein [Chloroflexota bacterium]|jgi:quercetin dioxygenase-like cupin family protein|nr:cupin domain-containing protein [Chloroflexota bacterium]
MPIKVFDFRKDLRNVFITPEIRARFLRMEPGEGGGRHSHDLGHEVFLVLEGQCEMEIEGERVVLGPGQMCVARANELHQATVVGDQPMTMYLSVTPHLEPTHTQWDAGRKRSPRYGVTRHAGGVPFSDDPVETIAERLLADGKTFAAIAHTAGVELEGPLTSLQDALRSGDRVAAKNAVDLVWSAIYRIRESLTRFEETWNELAVRAGGDPPSS